MRTRFAERGPTRTAVFAAATAASPRYAVIASSPSSCAGPSLSTWASSPLSPSSTSKTAAGCSTRRSA